MLSLWIFWVIIMMCQRPWNKNFRPATLRFSNSEYSTKDVFKAIFMKPYYETPYISCGSQRREMYMNTQVDKAQILSRISIIIEDDPVGFITDRGLLPAIAVDESMNVKDIFNAFVSELQTILLNKVLFVATPSRRLSPEKSLTLNRNIGTAINQFTTQHNLSFRIISKIDSCMRSNYESEYVGLSTGLNKFTHEVLIPAYIEQGRITIHGTQFIQLQGKIIPLHESEFSSFNGLEFHNSNLALWLSSKAPHIRSRKNIGLIDIDVIRSSQYSDIVQNIKNNNRVKTLVFDCAEESDITNIFNILCELEKAGENIYYKLGPSMINELVSVYTSDCPVNSMSNINKGSKGLIIAGSLSSKTKTQIDYIKDDNDTAIVLLSEQEIDNPDRTKIIMKKTNHVTKRLANDNVILTTEFWKSDKNEYPDLNKRDKVLQYFAEICNNVYTSGNYNNWFLMKGSDTALHTLIHGLKIKRYFYCGQVVPGVIHCKFEVSGNYKSFFIIGGNVGNENILGELVNFINQ